MPKLYFSWWRILVPSLVAAYAAVLAAGPGAPVVPASLRLVQPLVCPAGAQIEPRITDQVTETGEATATQNLYCAGAQGLGQEVSGRVFAILGSVYFTLLYLPLQAVFLTRRLRPVGARSLKPLGGEAEREVRALLARGRKLEAVQLVRARTGAGVRQAADYVEGIAAQPQLPSAAADAAGPLKTPVETLKQLKEMRDEGLITTKEFEVKKLDILAKL